MLCIALRTSPLYLKVCFVLGIIQHIYNYFRCVVPITLYFKYWIMDKKFFLTKWWKGVSVLIEQ